MIGWIWNRRKALRAIVAPYRNPFLTASAVATLDHLSGGRVIVGVVAVIMIIVGGLKYITSGGDSGNISGAKNTILYAVIGLIFVALAQVIVRFVLARSTNPSTG